MVMALAVVIGAILINALASQINWRVDLTSNQIYTLSPVSEKAVDDLSEPVEVRVIISADLPPPYHQLRRQVDELLMEYKAQGGSQFNVEFIEPGADEEFEELARGYGIEPVTIGQESERQRSYRAVYKGVAFLQGDRLQTIGDLRQPGGSSRESFEYEFTRALLNLEETTPRKVAVLTGAGGPVDSPQYVDLINGLVEELYGEMLVVEALSVDELQRLQEGYEALIILNIDSNLGGEAQAALAEYIDAGGNVGWYQSGGVVDIAATRQAYEQMRQAGGGDQLPQPVRKPLRSDLIDFFGDYGIRFGVDAVIDRQRAIAYGSVPTNQGQMPVSHPAIFPIDDLADELAFMRYFSTLVVPLPATVTVDEQRLPAGAQVQTVMRSSPGSVRLATPPARARYERLRRPIADEEQGAFALGQAMEIDVGADDPARLLVMGSGDLLSGYPEVGYQGELAALGIELFVTSLEWLAQEYELASIRGKNMPALVADVPKEARQAVQAINIVIVPAFFASFGLLMWLRRRRRRQELSALGAAERGQSEDDDA